MPKLHMTDVVVSRLKFSGTYYDETTPAFGLRVGKNRKTWFVVRGRERLRTNIGQYPATSLADARKEARKLLVENPTNVGRITFNAAYDIYKEALKSKKERTQYDYKRVLEKYLQPKLGTKKLADISYDDITAITNPLALSEKRNTLAVARTFFRWCVRPPRRYLKHSPLEGVEIPKAGKRKRILDEKELVAVWQATVRQGYAIYQSADAVERHVVHGPQAYRARRSQLRTSWKKHLHSMFRTSAEGGRLSSLCCLSVLTISARQRSSRSRSQRTACAQRSSS